MLLKKISIPLIVFAALGQNAMANADYLNDCKRHVESAYSAKKGEISNQLAEFKNSLGNLGAGMSATQSCVSQIANMGLNGSFSMPFNQVINMVVSQIDQQASKVCNAAYSQLSSQVSKATGNFGGTIKIGNQSVGWGGGITQGSGLNFKTNGTTLFDSNSSLFGNSR